MYAVVRVKYLPHYNMNWGELSYKHPGDSGFDLRAAIQHGLRIKPGMVENIPAGISVEIPDGYEIQVRSRSGLAFTDRLFILNSPGTIDLGYRGEIFSILANFGKHDYVVKPGMRIAQGVLSAVGAAHFETVSDLSESERGLGGFGSTGTN